MRLLTLLLLALPVAAQKEHGFDNRKASGQPYLSPQDTVAKMTVAPEFEAKLFAGEPQVVNPIAFTIDERGRVWVVECFEYPSRTPAGKMPRDRIVILEDTDGDGGCDKRTVFAEGKDFPERFDMASGIEVGNGGVYLGAPPYLWFIENTNDKPGKFEKLLSGFGSQDTHETLNTFQWGPDGWLYGLHGIYTQSNVKPLDGPEMRMNAAVWRYHPKTKKFEMFAEGTSNPWGMDWRSSDGQFILACCVIPHLYHIVPGGVYQRQAGASFNPHIYDPIKEICDHTFHKESGWAHAGLISLDVPHMPEKYRNSVIFGSIHGSSLKQNILKPNGSTFTASRGDDFLVSGDKNVRPINLKWGPNGDIYFIDWHDQNPCHQAAADSWDQERGRVYRIQLKGEKTYPAVDMSKKTLEELAQYAVSGKTPWHRRTAVRLLHENVAARPAVALPVPDDEMPLERLYRIDLAAHGLSQSRSPFIVGAAPELTAMRLRRLSDALLDTTNVQNYQNIPGVKTSVLIRRDLLSMIARKPHRTGVVTVLRSLAQYGEDFSDPLMPSLYWTAFEGHLSNPKTAIANELAWLASDLPPETQRFLVPRTFRRLSGSNLTECLTWLTDATDPKLREYGLAGLAAGLKGQTIPTPAGWAQLRPKLLAEKREAITKSTLALSVSFRDPEAVKAATEAAKDATKTPDERIDGVRQLALLKPADGATTLVALVNRDANSSVRLEAARALGAFTGVTLGQLDFAKLPREVQAEIVTSMAARKETAIELLNGVKAKTIDRAMLSDSTITRMQAFKDEGLSKLIDDVWGKTRPTPADLQKQIDALRNDLMTKSGDFKNGKLVFTNQCGKCHKFDGAGSDVGPPLDGAGRDIEYLLANILDPNRVVGAPYFVRQALTTDGQVIQGILLEEDDKHLSLKIENSVVKKLAKADLDGPVKVLERSIMPEGLAGGMKPQEFRDLVMYVMAHPFPSSATVNGTKTAVPVGGLIPLPEKDARIAIPFDVRAEMKTKLMVGSANAFTVQLNDKVIGTGKGTERKLVADTDVFEVTLPKGTHTLVLTLQSKWAAKGVYVRFLDPDRRIQYQE